MRKRISRPARFAAIDNGAIDSLPSILSVGLLTRLVRAKDGDEVTVESLAREYAEGRDALTKAMRVLVEAAFVVKFKVQRATTETVVDEETGEKSAPRGGSWWTTFSVDSVPFTVDDVAAMLQEIHDAGNVRAVRVEPAHLDPRKQPAPASRPTTGIPSVGPTCEDAAPGRVAEAKKPEESSPRPTDGFPTAGRPTVGQAAALIRKKTFSLSGDGEAVTQTGGERDSAPQAPSSPAAESAPGHHPVASAAALEFAAALPGRLGQKTARTLAPLVDAAFQQGYTPGSLSIELAQLVDVDRIVSRGALPGLYERALGDLPSPPARPAAHAQGPSTAAPRRRFVGSGL
ncbi:hypothetical protein ACF1A4_30385 [Streptomyces albidoflavus]